MKVRVKELEWFEKNCEKEGGDYYHKEKSYLCFDGDMIKNCGKVIKLKKGEYEDNAYQSWMYTEIPKKKKLVKYVIKCESVELTSFCLYTLKEYIKQIKEVGKEFGLLSTRYVMRDKKQIPYLFYMWKKDNSYFVQCKRHTGLDTIKEKE
jgi:hypothetical protein